ncbi:MULTISPECIES: IclR family transcriptional regulator [unclassified Haladaptatus]|uniref:IclR family transcriptional regulator n=1 Tax=unclassified Haladaptatus TaxID=2622732 RepID=UPI002FCE0F7C
MNEHQSRVKSVERTFVILAALKELDGARIIELGEHTGYANSTIHRHLTTLHEAGHVTKEGDTYHIGLSFLNFGEYVRNRKEAYRLAKPKVEELAQETNERCQYVVEEHGQGVYVHVATGPHAVETNSRIGSRLFLHSTSVGKAILAHLPAARVDEVLDQWGLPQLTEDTVVTKSELLAELETVRETGVAYNREGNVKGLRSVGTPVFGPEGTVVGALSVSGPTHRMKGDRYEREIPDLLLGAANELELKLKYS